MELDFTVSFAEQYKINPREYIDVHVTSLPGHTFWSSKSDSTGVVQEGRLDVQIWILSM